MALMRKLLAKQKADKQKAWFELAGELQRKRTVKETPKPNGYVADGLQSFL